MAKSLKKISIKMAALDMPDFFSSCFSRSLLSLVSPNFQKHNNKRRLTFPKYNGCDLLSESSSLSSSISSISLESLHNNNNLKNSFIPREITHKTELYSTPFYHKKKNRRKYPHRLSIGSYPVVTNIESTEENYVMLSTLSASNLYFVSPRSTDANDLTISMPCALTQIDDFVVKEESGFSNLLFCKNFDYNDSLDSFNSSSTDSLNNYLSESDDESITSEILIYERGLEENYSESEIHYKKEVPRIELTATEFLNFEKYKDETGNLEICEKKNFKFNNSIILNEEILTEENSYNVGFVKSNTIGSPSNIQNELLKTEHLNYLALSKVPSFDSGFNDVYRNEFSEQDFSEISLNSDYSNDYPFFEDASQYLNRRRPSYRWFGLHVEPELEEYDYEDEFLLVNDLYSEEDDLGYSFIPSSKFPPTDCVDDSPSCCSCPRCVCRSCGCCICIRRTTKITRKRNIIWFSWFMG